MEKLVGTVVHQVCKTDDNRDLLFITDKGDLVFKAEGDCCNSVWFEHMDNVDVFEDAEVLEVENIYGGELESDDWSVLENFFIKIKTTKGHCTIELRNSHNGYYGGYVRELIREHYEDLDFVAIDEDF